MACDAAPRSPRRFWPAFLTVALLTAAGAAPASQPIWQPAIYCAALDFTRADLLARSEDASDDWAGTAESATASGQAYLRIAAEALDCPGRAVLEGYLATARLSIAHRVEVAAGYGIDRNIMARPLASEAELVCELNFDPDMLEAARTAVRQSAPASPCADTD